MKRVKIIMAIAIIWTAASLDKSSAQEQTIGLFINSEEAYNGYTLFAPIPNKATYLIDNCGKQIHSWSSEYNPGHSAYLLEDGTLLRTGNVNNHTFNAGGKGGIIERIDEDNNIIWSYKISDDTQCQHHDIEYLPNGNILVISWDSKTAAEAIAAGRNPGTLETTLWSEKIIEIEPIGSNEANIVWEWHVWDHLIQDFDASQNNFGVIEAHPELVNLNYSTGNQFTDWLHINSVDYNAELDQILLSVHNFSEVWIIDHSTSPEEAIGNDGGNSGMGGDLLFRWGNPIAYQNGTVQDQMFFAQHDARWIETGLPDESKITVFNNGAKRPGGNYSSVDAIQPITDGEGHYAKTTEGIFLPENQSWQFIAADPSSFYSSNISGAEQMPNGNLLVCEGASGHFFEVDLDGNLFWEYINPVSTHGPMEQGEHPGGTPPNGNPNSVFRIKRYAVDYPGLQNYELNPGEPIELDPLEYDCENYTVGTENTFTGNETIICFPNPVIDKLSLYLKNKTTGQLEIFNIQGKILQQQDIQSATELKIDVPHLAQGLYFIRLNATDGLFVGKFLKS